MTQKFLSKISNFSFKHAKFLTLGTSVLFGAASFELFHLASPTGHPSFSVLSFLSIVSIFLTAYHGLSLMNTYRSISNNFYEETAEKLIQKYQENLIKKFKPNQYSYSSTDEEENQLVIKFINSIVLTQAHPRYLDLTLSTFDTLRAKDAFSNQDLLASLYNTEFKEDNLLVKSLIKSIEYKTKNERFSSIFSELFNVLWVMRGKAFTDKERIELDEALMDQDFAVEEEVFAQMSGKLQASILSYLKSTCTFEEDYKKINHNLIALHEKTMAQQEFNSLGLNTTHINTIKIPQSINTFSQQNIDAFETQFNSIFEGEQNLLLTIKTLMLEKEKLSSVLANFKDNAFFIEAKLFFDNDVDKTLLSFNEEIGTLHKMKLINHPQFDEFKTSTLASMVERMDMIKEKMITVMTQVNDNIAQELTSQIAVNKAVLKAKM